MTFAEKIKKLRKLLDITQLQLSVMLKTSQSAIACWETGVTGARTAMLERIIKLCVKKGVKINWRK